MYCLTCSKETLNPKFCSRSCAAIFNNRAHPKRKAKIGEVKLKRKPLTETTKGELKGKNKYLSAVWSTIRFHARKSTYKVKDKICESCGYDKHTEICHIKPISEFEDTALISEINCLSNIKVLCPNCHWEYDNGYLNL